MRKDAAEKNGTLLCSAGCVGSHIHIRSSLFTRSFKHFVGGEETNKDSFSNGE